MLDPAGTGSGILKGHPARWLSPLGFLQGCKLTVKVVLAVLLAADLIGTGKRIWAAVGVLLGFFQTLLQ